MSILASLTRMWLTRSVQPFAFKNEYDSTLSYADCSNLGLYVHAKAYAVSVRTAKRYIRAKRATGIWMR